jgi:hypothetical protein
MELVETYPCRNKEEALIRERYWIEQLNPSLNTVVRTHVTEEENK